MSLDNAIDTTNSRLLGDDEESTRRTIKRAKTNSSEEHRQEMIEESEKNNIWTSMPSEVWENVLKFLFYKDLLQLSVVNKAFLKDVVPAAVTEITVQSANELNVRPTYRFPNVKQVCMDCLFECSESDDDDDYEYHQKYTISEEAVIQIVPFLTKFPKLEFVDLSRWCRHYASGDVLGSYNYKKCVSSNHGRYVMDNLIRNLCGAFRSGALSGDIGFDGITCTKWSYEDNRRRVNEPCTTCRMVFQYFPLQRMIFWESIWWKEELPNMGSAYSSLLTCIPARKRLDMIASRPGGRDFLDDKYRHSALILEKLSHVSFFDDCDWSWQICFYLNTSILEELAALVSFKQTVEFSRNCITKSIIEGMQRHKSDSALKAMKEKPKFKLASFRYLEDIGLEPWQDAFRLVGY